MRRKDREITDFDEMMKIIAKCDTCRVAMFDETYPYIVPLNFGTDVVDNQLYLYFHGAKIGKKIDLMRSNKNVSFEMDCEHNIILYDERMSCTMGYESVIGYGEVEFLSEEEKMLDLVIGKTTDEARKLDDIFMEMIRGEASEENIEKLDEAAALQDISKMPARVKCAVLGWRTMREMFKTNEKCASCSNPNCH